MSSPQGSHLTSVLLERLFDSCNDYDPRIIPWTGCSPNIYSFNDLSPILFRTKKGYRDGYITNQIESEYQVIMLHDEHGVATQEFLNVPQSALVHSDHLQSECVSIYVSDPIDKKGYVSAGGPLKNVPFTGSGVYGSIRESRRRNQAFPIFNPLYIHDKQHLWTLQCASSLFMQAVEEDLPVTILDQIIWLINVVLKVDNYPSLSPCVIKEAMSNFVSDYTNFPSGSILKHPINYVLEILRIDGILSEISACVSFV